MNLFAKICHDDCVVFEKKFKTEAEAKAFVEGFYATLNALDLECDDHIAVAGSTKAEEQ